MVLSGPCAPIVLILLLVTLGFIVVITIIYFVVCVFGKGFTVDSISKEIPGVRSIGVAP